MPNITIGQLPSVDVTTEEDLFPTVQDNETKNVTLKKIKEFTNIHKHNKSDITDFPNEVSGSNLGLIKLDGNYTFTGILNVPTPALPS